MFLGIDVGTQSVKTLLYDAQSRRIVAERSAPLDMISEADGTREQMAHWWIVALHHCLARLDAKDKQAVKAIGVSGQQHGFVAVAEDDSVLAPVKLWCDTTTAPECAEITTRYGNAEQLRAEVGNDILPGYTAPKIRWLKNHKPKRYAQLHTVMLPHDYLNFYLTGERAMEHGDASGTGLLDIRDRQWHAGILQALDDDRDLAACLPDLVSAGKAMGGLRADIAGELGLPAGIPVVAGGGDNMMAAIGTGTVVPGRLTVSLGTSGTLFAYSDTPVLDPQGQLAAFCSSTGGWLPLLCTMNCTVATELTRQLFGASLEQAENRVAKAPAGAMGVTTLPFFGGERTPNLPNGKACILGLDEQNYSQANLQRSAMEAATFGLRAGLDAFSRVGCTMTEVRLTGGGAGSATWRQMVADVFDLPVSVLVNDQGAALGAALQAVWMQDGGTVAQVVDAHLQQDDSRACTPTPEDVGQYKALFERYQSHVQQIAPLYE